MKVLVIGYVWPEPNSSAAGSRMMQLLSGFLAQDWQVVFASPAQKTNHQQDLNSLGIKCHNIQVNDSKFDDFIKALNPDIVVYDRFMMEEQFGWRVSQHCPMALTILNTEDLHFLRNAREQAVRKETILTSESLRSEHAIREISAILRSDLTLMISTAESELLQREFGISGELLHYIPLMYNSSDFSGSPRTFEKRQHFITIGNFRHNPNWDSVLWLKKSIWPKIKARLPDAQMHIYGSYPPKKATQLNNEKQGFHVLGWTEDAKKVMTQARVCLAPLRFGAGIKGKLLEAMLCGTPSITTSIGAEGIATAESWPGRVEDDEEKIIESSIQLYQDAQSWTKNQTRGFDIIKNQFLTEHHLDALISKIVATRANLQSHRVANFHGMMMRHHMHRSTEFMSRWIESKNKLAATQTD